MQRNMAAVIRPKSTEGGTTELEPIKTLDEMSVLFENLKNCDNWSLQLLKIQPSKRNGLSYYARQITLRPEGKLAEVVEHISDHYREGDSSLYCKYERIDDYDGVNIGNIIYRIPTDSELIGAGYDVLVEAVNNPAVEDNLETRKYQGYVINGNLKDDGPVRLVSLQNPITSYKHRYRFICEGSSFNEIKGNVLQLKGYIDALIYNGNLYMMNLNAEKLFDMERSYRKKCEDSVELVMSAGIVSNGDAFKEMALSGHNPRKFISFNQNNLNLLAKSKSTRKRIGEKFDISLTSSGDFDTTDQKSANGLIKVLCNKAMLEPFGQEPMEVESARSWKQV